MLFAFNKGNIAALAVILGNSTILQSLIGI
jgi:hypothetical protein